MCKHQDELSHAMMYGTPERVTEIMKKLPAGKRMTIIKKALHQAFTDLDDKMVSIANLVFPTTQ